MSRRLLLAAWLVALAATATAAVASYIEEPNTPPDRQPQTPIVRPLPPPTPPPPPPGHNAELTQYLDRLEIGQPRVYGRLAVFPVVLRGGPGLGGNWLTMDEAFRQGALTLNEKDAGSVPLIWMENRSERDNILIVAGEVVAGGKQTRTIRQDVVLAPGQRVDVSVFCVEAHRWEGKTTFAPSPVMVPQSVQKEMRAGADQAKVWSEVARANDAAGARSATGNVEAGYAAAPVRTELDAARHAISPQMPVDAVGFLFIERFAQPLMRPAGDGPAKDVPSSGDNPSASDPSSGGRSIAPIRLGGRALGAEFFGNSHMAGSLLPKLIDAYAVDVVVLGKADRFGGPAVDNNVAREFLNRIIRAESTRADTPGSGSGVRIRSAGLVGDGVIFRDNLIHFAAQPEGRTVVVDPPVRQVPMPMQR
jgi:hypothetical protein